MPLFLSRKNIKYPRGRKRCLLWEHAVSEESFRKLMAALEHAQAGLDNDTTEKSEYKYASHMLVPVKSRSTVMFRVERKYPEQCWESDMDAFEKTLAFWKEVW